MRGKGGLQVRGMRGEGGTPGEGGKGMRGKGGLQVRAGRG